MKTLKAAAEQGINAGETGELSVDPKGNETLTSGN